MLFLNPTFFFAFAVLSIPVLIHLFNLRKYRKEYFTNVKYLTQIQQKTKKRSQLKQLLVLLSRLLALSSLILAFAQPYLPSPLITKSGTGHHLISVYIDNSFSMEANGSSGKLLETAKQKASEIASAFKASDIFNLMTNDADAGQNQFLNRDEFLNLLKEVGVSSSTREMSKIISRQNEVLHQQQNVTSIAFLISDFQKTTTDIESSKPDSSVNYILVPLVSNKTNNLYIDSVRFISPSHRPGQAVKLVVYLKNSGSESLEKIPLRLVVNDIQKAVTSFNIEGKQEIEITVPYTENPGGLQRGKIEITDFPVTFDDKLYFSYFIKPEINVLSLHGPAENPFLRALFSSDSSFIYQNVNSAQVDYNSLSSRNLIIVSGLNDFSTGLVRELQLFTSQGGSLVVFPVSSPDARSLNLLQTSLDAPIYGHLDTVRQRVSWLDLENDLFRDVFEKDRNGKTLLPMNADLPTVFRFYKIILSNRMQSIDLMKLQDDQPFLLSNRYGKGTVYSFAVPCDPVFSNFQQHDLFVPVLLNMALLSQSPQELFHIIGKNEAIKIPTDSAGEKTLIKVMNFQGNAEFIPETRTMDQQNMIFVHDQIRDAGWYYCLRNEKIISGLSFNYNRKESELDYYSALQAETLIKKMGFTNMFLLQQSKKPITHQIEQPEKGIPLWRLFILSAIFFILCEIALLRLMKE